MPPKPRTDNQGHIENFCSGDFDASVRRSAAAAKQQEKKTQRKLERRNTLAQNYENRQRPSPGISSETLSPTPPKTTLPLVPPPPISPRYFSEPTDQSCGDFSMTLRQKTAEHRAQESKTRETRKRDALAANHYSRTVFVDINPVAPPRWQILHQKKNQELLQRLQEREEQAKLTQQGARPHSEGHIPAIASHTVGEQNSTNTANTRAQVNLMHDDNKQGSVHPGYALPTLNVVRPHPPKKEVARQI